MRINTIITAVFNFDLTIKKIKHYSCRIGCICIKQAKNDSIFVKQGQLIKKTRLLNVTLIYNAACGFKIYQLMLGVRSYPLGVLG